MDLEHAAAAAERPHRLEDRGIAEPEVEHHERLGGWHTGFDHRRQLRDRVVHPAEDRRAERVVDGRVGRRDPPELVDAGNDRAMGRGRRPGPGVVEREERRRPAERGSHGVLEEAVRRRRRSRRGCGCGRRCSRGGRAGRWHRRPRVAPAGGAGQVGFDAVDRPARTATSARREPVAVTTVPPRISRSGPEPSMGGTAEEYGVRARQRPSVRYRASGRGPRSSRRTSRGPRCRARS